MKPRIYLFIFVWGHESIEGVAYLQYEHSLPQQPNHSISTVQVIAASHECEVYCRKFTLSHIVESIYWAGPRNKTLYCIHVRAVQIICR